MGTKSPYHIWLKRIFSHAFMPVTSAMMAITIAISLPAPLRAATGSTTQHSQMIPAGQSKSHSYAAAECLTIAARHLNLPIDSISLMSHMSWSSEEMPTAEAVIKLAQSQKLQAQSFTTLTPAQLKACPYPAILQVMGGRYSSGPDHFIVVIPSTDADFTIISPPNNARHISAVQLAQRWKGSAIVVAPSSAAPYQPKANSLPIDATTMAKMIGLLALVCGCWISGQFMQTPAAQLPKRIGRAVFQAFLLVSIAGGASAIAWSLADAQPLKAAVAIRESKDDSVEFFVAANASATLTEIKIPEITEPEARALSSKGIQFIDARDLNEFNAGHIRGSLCAPASDVSRLRIHTAGLPKDQQLVVYCAIKNCGKGHYIANALMQEGFSRVVLYADGWAKWTGPKE